jgi:hypothetical protein
MQLKNSRAWGLDTTKRMMAEIGDFIKCFNQPTYRGMRVNGVRGADLFEPAWYQRVLACHPGTSRKSADARSY